MKWWLLNKFGYGIFFVIIAAICLVAAVIPNVYKIIDRHASGNFSPAIATIERIDVIKKAKADEHEVYVSFAVQGQMYTSKLDTYVEGMQMGDTVDILYDKTNPYNITLKGFWEFTAGLFAAVSLVFGGIGFWMMHRRKKKYGIG